MRSLPHTPSLNLSLPQHQNISLLNRPTNIPPHRLPPILSLQNLTLNLSNLPTRSTPTKLSLNNRRHSSLFSQLLRTLRRPLFLYAAYINLAGRRYRHAYRPGDLDIGKYIALLRYRPDTIAKDVRIESEHILELSDNFIDLLPGTQRQVEVQFDNPPEEFDSQIKITTVASAIRD